MVRVISKRRDLDGCFEVQMTSGILERDGDQDLLGFKERNRESMFWHVSAEEKRRFSLFLRNELA